MGRGAGALWGTKLVLEVVRQVGLAEWVGPVCWSVWGVVLALRP